MKLVLIAFMLFSGVAFAQNALVAAPVAPAAPIAQASQPDPVMVKDVSVAPPNWMQDVMVSIKSLPMVGPIAVKVLNWLGVLVSILTALSAFMMIAIQALSSVMNVAQLSDLASKIKGFQDGKLMYYLKYLSMFNAQKPAQVEPSIVLEKTA